MKCLICKEKQPIDYESVGLGLYCQDCLDGENDIWLAESGFKVE